MNCPSVLLQQRFWWGSKVKHEQKGLAEHFLLRSLFGDLLRKQQVYTDSFWHPPPPLLPQSWFTSSVLSVPSGLRRENCSLVFHRPPGERYWIHGCFRCRWGSFEGRFLGCLLQPGTSEEQTMTPWAFPPGEVGIGSQSQSAAAAVGHFPEVCLPLLLMSASSMELLIPGSDFSVFLQFYFGICFTLLRHSKHLIGFSISCSQASRGKLFAGKSCWLWAGNSDICPGAEDPWTPGLCACVLVTECRSQPGSAGLLLPGCFLKSYFVPGTVLVAKDIDNSSHSLSIDSARHPLRADAMTILIFTDKTEFQREEIT